MDPTTRLTTRTVLRRNFAIVDPAGFCPTTIPGFGDATAYIMASPGLGASFAHYRVHVPPEGSITLAPAGAEQCFVYVIEGEASARTDGHGWGLVGGGFVYVPPEHAVSVTNVTEAPLVLFVCRHPFRAGPAEPPWMTAGDVGSVEADAREEGSFSQRRLLPDDPAFDLMINVLEFGPGDAHPFVENHHETHGLYMLRGEGKYFLDDQWYAVGAGDYIWMGSFVPQAFVCTGNEVARYIYSKEANRDVRL